MIRRKNLLELSKWAGIVGIINIILGALSAVCGVFAFIVGAIPGVIMIVLGVKLRNTKKYADEMLASDQDEEKLNMLFISLNSYFMIQGILLLIALVLSALGLLGGLFAGCALFNLVLY